MFNHKYIIDMRNPFVKCQQPNLFTQEDKKIIYQTFNNIPIKTGDIFFRSGWAKFYGIPFSFIVSLFTQSKYSHASICLIEKGEVKMVEIDENGVRKSDLEDWLSYNSIKNFVVYRMKDCPDNFNEKITIAILNFLDKDPEYDYSFNDKNKFYCTESVVHIYQECGYEIFEGHYLKELMPNWIYSIFMFFNKMVGKLTKASLPNDVKGYFVGNEKRGMIASKFIHKIYSFLS